MFIAALIIVFAIIYLAIGIFFTMMEQQGWSFRFDENGEYTIEDAERVVENMTS